MIYVNKNDVSVSFWHSPWTKHDLSFRTMWNSTVSGQINFH